VIFPKIVKPRMLRVASWIPRLPADSHIPVHIEVSTLLREPTMAIPRTGNGRERLGAGRAALPAPAPARSVRSTATRGGPVLRHVGRDDRRALREVAERRQWTARDSGGATGRREMRRTRCFERRRCNLRCNVSRRAGKRRADKAEGGRFELPRALGPGGFQDRCLKPGSATPPKGGSPYTAGGCG
jgi:hypothetical protein